ncbi:MAG: ferrous iron transporter B [Ignavibacteriaceae bacterium]|nr:ferrous iron transporter B [Ignavibacteriaceae bacterium]
MSDKQKELLVSTANSFRWKLGENFHDALVETIYNSAKSIADSTVKVAGSSKATQIEDKIDRVITSRLFGFPIMLMILAIIFWLTIVGANYPSGMLAEFLVDYLHPLLKNFGVFIGLPAWLNGLIFDGAYLALAWVISVMLPPMAIFFPIFTLLEDLGYLPRVAFNMDSLYRRAGAHGKQALTMSMGFGCNAAGVIAARIIDSPRERLIAIITNNFSLCNGRWPTQILIATIFIGGAVPAHFAGLVSAAAVVGVAVLGIAFSLIVSLMLSKTVLKGQATSFSLELPPYRPPHIGQILYKSLIERTLMVLWRAIVFAAPAGLVIWTVANVHISGISLAEHFINWANPFGFLIGLNGVILLAYIIAIPANEIVIPTILMLTVLVTGNPEAGAGAGVMFEMESIKGTGELLQAGGWTIITGVCIMLFSLLHNPCSTTIYTIYKETGSIKWTTIATFLPVLMGIILCFITAGVLRMLGVS